MVATAADRAAAEVAWRRFKKCGKASTETYAHFEPDTLKRAADERAEAMRKLWKTTMLSPTNRSLRGGLN